jgi:tRNA uridine 5-carbamoylmethylation protein Kti12
MGTVCVVGPPGAGKTTIGRAVASRVRAEFYSIDDWVGTVYEATSFSNPMTDMQVDQALSLLFGAIEPTFAICEFAYHDYVSLLTDDRYPAFMNARKVIVTADLETCIVRNEARRSPVPATYVERAWHSTRALIGLCTTELGSDALLVNTTTTSVAAAVPMTIDFLEEE